MLHQKVVLLVLLMSLLAAVSWAQCPDFLDLNSENVSCYSGMTYNPMLDTGVVAGRHTLITQQGTDFWTNNELPLLPEGEGAVIRLGNNQSGAEAESIVYTFTVDPDHSILLIKYAVVLENPSHESLAQPRFIIRMLDENNELLDPCMEYDVTSADDIPGFQSFGHIRWRPWTNNGFDLSTYVGQTVKLQLITYDCSWGAHFGYAYFTASCISDRLSLDGCDGNQVTLSARTGFSSYNWSNGATTETTNFTVQGNSTVNCVISTVTGCLFTLSGIITSQNIPGEDLVLYDTICEGEPYQSNGFDLPPADHLGVSVFHNTYINQSDCSDDITATLYLYAKQRYFHIYDMACEGDNYDENGFHFTNLTVGEIVDTNYVAIADDCDSITVLHLTVNSSFTLDNVINGPTEICSNTSGNYFLTNPLGLTAYHWNVPDGVEIVYGQGTNFVQLFFSQMAPNPSHISLTGANGCGNGSTPLDVTVHPSYVNIVHDTVCSGETYSQYGFDLGVLEESGNFVHTRTDSSAYGCENIDILLLFVSETPPVSVLADPQELCLGETTELHAASSQSSVTLLSQLPKIWVGDILCTDNTFVHPQNWPTEKTPKAIVYYVDPTGEHGWAVNLHDDGNPCAWGTNAQWPAELNIPDLDDCGNARAALSDYEGHLNTFHIRNYYPSDYYPAAYSVDYEDGWYLPAAGQAYQLYTVIPFINPSLELVGGTPFSPDTEWKYWTSSEINSLNVWLLYSSRGLYYDNKNHFASVRSIRSF